MRALLLALLVILMGCTGPNLFCKVQKPDKYTVQTGTLEGRGTVNLKTGEIEFKAKAVPVIVKTESTPKQEKEEMVQKYEWDFILMVAYFMLPMFVLVGLSTFIIGHFLKAIPVELIRKTSKRLLSLLFAVAFIYGYNIFSAHSLAFLFVFGAITWYINDRIWAWITDLSFYRRVFKGRKV